MCLSLSVQELTCRGVLHAWVGVVLTYCAIRASSVSASVGNYVLFCYIWFCPSGCMVGNIGVRKASFLSEDLSMLLLRLGGKALRSPAGFLFSLDSPGICGQLKEKPYFQPLFLVGETKQGDEGNCRMACVLHPVPRTGQDAHETEGLVCSHSLSEASASSN